MKGQLKLDGESPRKISPKVTGGKRSENNSKVLGRKVALLKAG